MTTVLVPLDGSPLSTRALPYATALARATGGRIVLVRAALAYVYESEGVSQIVPLSPHTQADLDAVADRVRASGVEVEAHVVHGFAAASAIVSAIEEHRAHIVVMSTHGRGGIGRFIYGSVADQVLRSASVPVLLVPGAARSWPTDRPLRALAPLDGSDLADLALSPLADLARVLPIEVVLARTIETPHYHGETVMGFPPTYAVPTVPDPAEALRVARRDLEDQAARLAGVLTVAGVRVEVGHAATAIAPLAREEDADVIVMSTHGRGGLTRLVMGSVATATLQHATVPVLLVPARVRPDATIVDREEPPMALTDDGAVAPATITLSPTEAALVQYGLELVLHNAERDEKLAAPVRALLERIKSEASARQTVGAGR